MCAQIGRFLVYFFQTVIDTMVAGLSPRLLYDHPLVFMYDLAGLIQLVVKQIS